MQINGGVRFCEHGMRASIRAMHVQTQLLGMINENVAGFDKVGYQRKEGVVSSMTEYLGVHGLSTTIDDQVGRIMVSDNPLDIVNDPSIDVLVELIGGVNPAFDLIKTAIKRVSKKTQHCMEVAACMLRTI